VGKLDYKRPALSWDPITKIASLTKHLSTDGADAATIVEVKFALLTFLSMPYDPLTPFTPLIHTSYPHQRSSGAEVLIIKEMALDAATISSLDSSVSLICEAGTGYNNIDLVAARERNIAVTNIPDYSSEAVATVVMTAILNFSGSILQTVVETKSSMQGREVFRMEGYQRPLFELRGKRLGLIGGNGTIGKKVTAMAAPFGLDVVVTSRSGNVGPGQTNISMEELLKTSDFVSFHAPLNDATRGMMGKEQVRENKERSDAELFCSVGGENMWNIKIY
jgi:lactate dehydrogenase-like 2-hydroxyacid dehydrogenase